MIEAVAAGATGYLQKVSGMEQLLATVRDVAAGEIRVPASIVRRVFAAIGAGAEREEKGPGRADAEGPADTRLVLPGAFVRPDSGSQGCQAGDHSKRRLRHPGKAVLRLEAGDGGLGGAERAAG